MQWPDASCLRWVLQRPDQKLRRGDLTATRAQREPRYISCPSKSLKAIMRRSYCLHWMQVGHVRISEHSNLRYRAQERSKNICTLEIMHTLRAFIFFKSIPTSAVTPSPNLKLDAATCCIMQHRGGNRIVLFSHLERIFFLYCVHRCCKSPQLTKSLYVTTK